MSSLVLDPWCPGAVWRTGHACSGARCTVRGMLRWAWELITRDRQQEMKSARRTLRGMLRLAWELITRDRRAADIAAQTSIQGGAVPAMVPALLTVSPSRSPRTPSFTAPLVSVARERGAALAPACPAMFGAVPLFSPALPATPTLDGPVTHFHNACSTFHPVTTSSRGRRI